MLVNVLGSEVKQVPFQEFIHDVAKQEGIMLMLKEEGAEGLVKYEGLNLSRSGDKKGDKGHMSIIAFGSRYPHYTLEQLSKGRMGDVPSQFQYPTQWCKKP